MMNFPDAEMIDLGEIELEVFQAGQGGMPVVLALSLIHISEPTRPY